MYFNSFLFFGRDALPPGKLRDTVDQMYAAYKVAGHKVSPASGFGWDPGWVVVKALRELGPNVTVEALRNYLEQLHDFPGVDGVYDFPRTADNHGLTDLSVIVVTWNPAKGDFAVASKPGGYPLK